MSKKQRISPIATFQINTDIVAGDLPNPAQVEETVAVLTGKPVKVEEKPKETAVEKVIEKVEEPGLKKEVSKKKQAVEKPKQEVIQEIKYQIKYGRPQKEIAAGRAKFTTMLQPDIIKQLKRHAIDKGITVADLLETIIDTQLNKKS